MTTPPQPPRYPDRDRNAEGRAENARPRDRFGAPLPRGSVDELAHRQEPDDVVSTVAEAFDHAVSLFNEERFFEAHEFMEYIWKSDEVAPQDRDFWKGVTQVAVGCCHVQRGNVTGAITLLERAAHYMSPYPQAHNGVATGALSERALRLAAAVRDSGASPEQSFFTFPRTEAPAPSGD